MNAWAVWTVYILALTVIVAAMFFGGDRGSPPDEPRYAT